MSAGQFFVCFIVASLLVVGFSALIHGEMSRHSIIAAMMIRDEAVNLKVNLPLMAQALDAFVFIVDERTTDESVEVINRVLKEARCPYVIEYYKFEGFGQARSLTLNLAWKHFNNITHILISDPDWKPDLATIKKSELDLEHDVFRFSVFDRSGLTTRKMDWLLRHREGLRMKYSLHEVLDIGIYTVKQVGWIIHEIEQFGSWHATVGHQNSTSAKRFEFDIHLLRKDVLEYGHDPHTHYYLGITLQAYAERLISQQGIYNESLIDEAVHFLQLRAFSSYAEEFLEERWASLYMLGGIYSAMKKEFLKASYYLSLCRDYNPKQAECSIGLSLLYLDYGVLDSAVEEMESLLRQEFVERLMLNILNVQECQIPSLVVRVLAAKSRLGHLSIPEAKLLVMMAKKAKDNEVCRVSYPNAELDAEGLRRIERILSTSSIWTLDFCTHQDFQSLILQKKLKFHACDTLKAQMAVDRMCKIYLNDLPVSEERQVAATTDSLSNIQSYVGAANIPDLVHYAYKGDSSLFVGKGKKLRFLFPQYFKPQMVANLIGYFFRNSIDNYEIVIVSKDSSTIQQFKTEMSYCSQAISEANKATMPHLKGTEFLSKNILFLEKSIDEYLSDANVNTEKFDYIEFNGGLSMIEDSNQATRLLQQLSNLLEHNHGVLGVTVFNNNSHVRALRNVVDGRNKEFHLPFSLESNRLIVQYLNMHGLGIYANDEDLLKYLGANVHIGRFVPAAKPSMLNPVTKWRGFHDYEIEMLLQTINLHITSWVPMSNHAPYDELLSYSVKQFESFGVSQETFKDQFFSEFRSTLYVVRSDPAIKHALGKVQVKDALNSSPDIRKQIVVIDRAVGLGSILGGFVPAAKLGQSGKFGITPLHMKKAFGLDIVTLPFLAPCLAKLSDKVSIEELLSLARNFVKEHPQHFAHVTQRVIDSSVAELLTYLESIHAITLWSADGPIHDSRDSISKNASLASQTSKSNIPESLRVQEQFMNELQFDQEFISSLIGEQDASSNNKKAAVKPERSSLNAAPKLTGAFANAVQGGLKINQQTSSPAPKAQTEQQQKQAAATKKANDLSLPIKSAPKTLSGNVMQGATEGNKQSTPQDATIQSELQTRQKQVIIPPNIANFKIDNSFRSLNCALVVNSDKRCAEPKPVRRKTAGLRSTSYLKLLFDLSQLEYLRLHDVISPQLYSKHKELLESILRTTQFGDSNSYKIIRVPDNLENIQYLNRALVYTNVDDSNPIDVLFPTPVIKMLGQMAAAMVDNIEFRDFLVLDTVLTPNARDSIHKSLLQSSIWFDVTNGAAFVSYADDGMDFTILHNLAQQLAASLTPPGHEKSLKITKCFALAMNSSQRGLESGIMMGNRNEWLAVMWLSKEDASDETSGVRFYDPNAANCLFSQGISVYPSSHPDFLSKNGDLAIDVIQRCKDVHHEVVPRKDNRLIIIKDRIPVSFVTGEGSGAKKKKSFEDDSMIALVFVLSLT